MKTNFGWNPHRHKIVVSLPFLSSSSRSFKVKIAKMKSEAKSVKELYCGAEIFITGASGFIGKVLVEKLLRSCPDVKEIYLLMRPKKGQTGEDRIQQLTDNLVNYSSLI